MCATCSVRGALRPLLARGVGVMKLQGVEIDRLVIELPWPDRKLSPNARPNRFDKARATKKARAEARMVMSSHARELEGLTGALSFQAMFNPPVRRNHDDDNLMASIKAYRDGIADALGIDDNIFQIQRPIVGPPVKGGNVKIEIRPVAE